MNMEIQISFWGSVFVFFGYIPRSEITVLYGSSIFNILRTSILFSILTEPIYFPTESAQMFPFLCSLSNICYHFQFWWFHYNQCEVISHCDFELHFLDNKWYWASLHVPVGHPYVFFGKMSVQFLCPFLISCFVIKLQVIYLDINALLDIWFENIFSHF